MTEWSVYNRITVAFVPKKSCFSFDYLRWNREQKATSSLRHIIQKLHKCFTRLNTQLTVDEMKSNRAVTEKVLFVERLKVLQNPSASEAVAMEKNSIHCSNIIVRQRSTFSKSSWLSTTTIYPWQTIMSNYLDPGVGLPFFCRSKHRPGFLDKKPMRSLKLDLGILQKIISEANKSLWYFKVLFSKQSSQISTTFWFSKCK